MLFLVNFSYCFLLVVTCVTYTVQQTMDPAFLQEITNLMNECQKEIGLDQNVVEKAWNENHFPNDEKLKCFFKCLNMKLGILTPSGEVVDEKLLKVSLQLNDAATAKEIADECGRIQGPDLCDTAMKLAACVKQAELD